MENFRIPNDHAKTLVDPTAYADGRIYETYAWLRANMPLGIAEVEGFDPFWAIVRHQDVRAIGRDNKLFPYGNRPSMMTNKASEALVRSITGTPYFGRSLVSMDPPDHMKFRLLTQAWFMPKHLKTLDQQIEEIAGRTIEKFIRLNGECDFVVDVALNYPLEVIMEILGVPKHDLQFMLRLTQEIFAPADPESAPEGVDLQDPAYMAQAMKTTVDTLDTFFKKITQDRRQNPRNDIATIIATALIDGAPMSDYDAVGYYTIIATAGHDTTSSSMAAAMYAIATQPNLLPRLRADPSLIPALIEEAIRWSAPVKHFMRSVSEDIEFEGRSFKKNDWLMLCYASANRDEAVFTDGASFNIDRPKTDHLAFGFGPHVCIGQHLARREILALFRRIIPLLKSVEIIGSPEVSQSFFVSGFKHLPIRFTLDDQPTQVAA